METSAVSSAFMNTPSSRLTWSSGTLGSSSRCRSLVVSTCTHSPSLARMVYGSGFLVPARTAAASTSSAYTRPWRSFHPALL